MGPVGTGEGSYSPVKHGTDRQEALVCTDARLMHVTLKMEALLSFIFSSPVSAGF